MTRQLVLRSPTIDRRRPLLNPLPPPRQPSKGARVAEVAGATAAECAAVCCCCPCGIAGLVVLAVYRVPAGLCRRLLKNINRRRLLKQVRCSHSGFEGVQGMDVVSMVVTMEEQLLQMRLTETEMDEFEEEILKTFYSSGFWRRSPSEVE